jgi:hypothetical protein
MDQQEIEGRGRGRHRRWMLLLFLLLPGVLVLGLIAPDLVKVAPAEEQQLAGEGEPIFRPGPLRKTPLLVPRDFSTGFTPELFDLENLFSRTPYAPSQGQLSRIVAFPQNSGELIALDEVDQQLKEIAFKDVLAAAITPRTELPGISPFLPLANPLPRGNGVRYDDFPGAGNGSIAFTTPVPEPDTALLLGLGLIGLGAARRRSRSRRGQRQPTVL